MADLTTNLAGIQSPNPFWLASAPPTNSGDQVMRAFDLGWGGAVWKTLGNPIVNVSSRLGGIAYGERRLMGLNNVELITDRPLADNLREIADVKKRYPDHALVVSLMFDTREEWEEMVLRCEDTGCDGLELNFGCPHGMCERGMGSAVGQEPKVLEELVRWVVESTRLPVIAKLTPNITDPKDPARAARRGGAAAVSLINTVQSLMGVDLDRLIPCPVVGDASSHGGYCGPAVKPIALRMVAELARDAESGLPISGIGGIETWRDAAEFLALGATNVQVCTAVMHHGYRIVGEMIEGLDDYLEAKGMKSVGELVGAALPAFREWGDLDLNHHVVAEIDEDLCIKCQLCIVACHDGAHQCVHPAATAPVAGRRAPWVDEPECVGCNLCQLVCPVEGCITMVERRRGPGRESWNDRVAAGRAHVAGGLADLGERGEA
ncbi:MAG: NAD-dependent dihydropyrimidine dehydrogenase subunit PreA [Candidatus Eiseniibacteriota bacterium]